MKLQGANPKAKIAGVEELTGKSNYLIGHDTQKWRHDVTRFAKVKYQAVYPGIDLIYYGQQRQLEYDWIVAPQANVDQIRLSVAGVSRMQVDPGGDLILQTSGGEVRQHKPIIYQEADGEKQLIEGRYVMKGSREVGFELAAYDSTRAVVIDPVLSYSTYLGGNGTESQDPGIVLDKTGNIYLAGRTASADFPILNAFQPNYGGTGVDGVGDVVVTKLSADGATLIYSTYLGGSGDDEAYSLAVGTDGSVYVAGDTSSTNFPLKNPFQASFSTVFVDSYHAFITKLTPDGSALVYSTYLGGTDDTDTANSIAVDAAGNAYITGYTNSVDFPVTNAIQPNYQGGGVDAFIAKLNPAGSALLFSTFLGGNSSEDATDIAVDDSGVYVAGITSSTNFPLRNAVQSFYNGTGVDGIGDGFVTKLTVNGSAVVFSTYLGGSGDDEIFSLAVGPGGSVYVTGDTSSTNFPLKNPLQSSFSTLFSDSYHVFVTRLIPDGSALAYSTYLGGSGYEDFGAGIAVDIVGNAYLTGSTNSSNFPVVNALQAVYRGGPLEVGDAFAAKINPSGSTLVYSSFLGGTGDEIGNHIKVDSIGNAYIIGLTTSTNFPMQSPYQSSLRGLTDFFITKIGSDAVTVSGASFIPTAIASKAIVSVFGPFLATAAAPAASIPLPTTLAGTTVKITDSAGTERLAPLYYASPNQVNYQIPDGTVPGPAAVLVTSSDGRISTGVMQVNTVATNVFTLNQSGTGPAAALDAITFTGAPFSATRANGQPNIIALYATGLGADVTDVDGDASASTQATIAGNPMTVLYAGRAPGYVGLNQFL